MVSQNWRLMCLLHLPFALAIVLSSSATHNSQCYFEMMSSETRRATRTHYYSQSYTVRCTRNWNPWARCGRTRQVAGTEYYSYSVPVYVQRSRCCTGYREGSSGRCEPLCSTCQNGVCVHPNQCRCNPGYTGAACDTDIVECAQNNGGCDQNCTNTIGSFTCSCGEGFILSTDERSCDNINECIEGTNHCQHSCVNTMGSYECHCRAGYRLTSDGFTCIDINECTEDVDDCAQICTDTEGSYNCSCGPGYKLANDQHGCDVSIGVPLQVRFSLSTDSEATCAQFVNEKSEEKASALTLTISQQISQACNCPYMQSFIDSHRFFCNDDTKVKTVIYQAIFLVVDGTTPEAIQNTIQNWVLTKPFITVDSQRYQLDATCSVVIQEVGVTSCDAIQPASSADSQVNLYYYVGGGGGALLLLLVTVGVIITVTVCVIKGKTCTSRKNRQSCTVPAAELKQSYDNPVYCDHLSGDNHFHEEKTQHYKEYCESPTIVSGGGNVYETKIPESYEVPSSLHHSSDGHNRIQPDSENSTDSNSHVYDVIVH